MRTNDLDRLRVAALAMLALAGAGCSGVDLRGRGPGPEGSTEPPVSGAFTPIFTTGGVTNTFHHPQSIDGVRVADAREVLARMEEEGPPAYRARVHACRKMRYGTIGRMLASLGVDTAADGETSPGRMWREADQALGAPNYAARIPETTELTTASASRLFDILVQAAPEIIASMPTQERCMVGERGATIFDADGACTEEGLTCLLGEPASAEHVELCTVIARRATTPEKGRIVAVASMLAAAATCE
ncbi:MAG: hypothetical protein M3Y87_25350 [Myxococcota bacterium]|nr:hypothetical protein [Myxococcota bacterium]